MTINVLFAQKLTLPEKPYVIVIGKDTLVTKTIIEKAPHLYENFTLENKAVYGNPDSLRVWTYLLNDKKYSINFPQRIDTVISYDFCTDAFTGKEYISIDTTDHIDVNKLIDTISAKELRKLLRTEIKVYCGNKKLQVRWIRIMLVWPNGDKFEIDFEGTKIGNYLSIINDSKTISANGHLILSRIWFYDEKKEPNGFDGKIAWKIR